MIALSILVGSLLFAAYFIGAAMGWDRGYDEGFADALKDERGSKAGGDIVRDAFGVPHFEGTSFVRSGKGSRP